MRSSRVLSFAVSLCITFGIICGTTSAASTFNVPTLEDMGVDAWQDLEEIQGAEPQEPPELVDPIVDFEPPFTYDLVDDSGWILKSDKEVFWTYISQYGYAGDYYWQETETFGPEVSSVLLDFVNYGGYEMVGGLVGVPSDTCLTLETYQQTYAMGEYSLVGEVFGALGIQLGSGAAASKGYMYPDYVELVAKDNSGDRYTLGSWELTDGRVYVDEVITLPDTVMTLRYNFYYIDAETKEIRPGGTSTQAGLVFAFSDGFTLNEYVPESVDTGLLRGILAWLQSILDAIISLPGRVADAVLDGLQRLFVPSAEDIAQMKEMYLELLSSRLGFVYQGFEFVVNGLSSVLDAMTISTAAEGYFIHFPGISFPYKGEVIWIVQEQEVSLDNAVMDVLRPVLGTAVSFICVVAFLNTTYEMVLAILAGWSYADFISKRREEDAL